MVEYIGQATSSINQAIKNRSRLRFFIYISLNFLSLVVRYGDGGAGGGFIARTIGGGIGQGVEVVLHPLEIVSVATE
ncbi:MAG: hypothetical protein ABL858_06180 [Candidatus Nitrotoga sp.]